MKFKIRFLFCTSVMSNKNLHECTVCTLDQLNALLRLPGWYTAIADWLKSKSLFNDWPVGGTIMVQLQRTQKELEIQMGRG